MSLEYLSHLKWFVSDNTVSATLYPTFGEFIAILIFIALGIGAVLAIHVLMQRYTVDRIINTKTIALQSWAPTIVRLSFGLLLVINYFNDVVVAENFHAESTAVHIFSILSLIIGLWLLVGVWPRLASGSVMVLFIFGIFLFGTEMLDHTEYIGISLFGAILGGGALTLYNNKDPLRHLQKYSSYAFTLLLVFVGLGLVITAFTEKLFAIHLAQQFLVDYHWNFLSAFGVSNYYFILFIGSMEVIMGLSLILGIATRFIAINIAAVMSLTAMLLGPSEIVGHLYALGFIIAVCIGPITPHKITLPRFNTLHTKQPK